MIRNKIGYSMVLHENEIETDYDVYKQIVPVFNLHDMKYYDRVVYYNVWDYTNFNNLKLDGEIEKLSKLK